MNDPTAREAARHLGKNYGEGQAERRRAAIARHEAMQAAAKRNAPAAGATADEGSESNTFEGEES